MGQLNPHPMANFTSTIGPGITTSLLQELERIYPAPIQNASANTNTYLTTDTQGWALGNDYTFTGAAFAISQAYKKHGLGSWYYRFDAPQTTKFPAYYAATHSADNWHLQNATSTMNSTEVAVEPLSLPPRAAADPLFPRNRWRAYLSSFLKHDECVLSPSLRAVCLLTHTSSPFPPSSSRPDLLLPFPLPPTLSPNKARLGSAPEWLETSTTFRFAPRLVIQQQLAASANLSMPTSSAVEIVPANEYDRLRLWTSEEVISATRQ